MTDKNKYLLANGFLPGFAVAFVLFARFLIKSDLNSEFLFSQDNALGLSGAPLRLCGFAMVTLLCALWGAVIGGFVFRCGEKRQGAAVLTVLFAAACPAVFPFLFRTSSVDVGELLAQLAFAAALFTLRIPFARWLSVLVTSAFAFSAFVPWAKAFSDAALLYVPLLLLCAALFADEDNLLSDSGTAKGKAAAKASEKKGDSKQSKALFFICTAVAVAGLILKLTLKNGDETAQINSVDSLSTVFGAALIVLPLVFFSFCFYASVLKSGKRERLFSFICTAQLLLIAVCVINRKSICLQCIPMLAGAHLLTVGFICENASDSYDKPLCEIAEFFKSKPILTAVMLIYMAMFTAASTGVAPTRFTDLIPY